MQIQCCSVWILDPGLFECPFRNVIYPWWGQSAYQCRQLNHWPYIYNLQTLRASVSRCHLWLPVDPMWPVPLVLLKKKRKKKMVLLLASLTYLNLRVSRMFSFQDTNRLEYLIPKKTSLRHRLPMGDQGFIDFVAHLLEINPKKRPTASEALQHPWLSYPYEPISSWSI